MKRYILFILFLLIPFIVNAEVKITNIEQIDITEGLKVDDPTYKDLTINFNIKFNKVEDFIKYKVTIKNDTNKDYEIATTNNDSKDDYIKYKYKFDDDDKIIKANNEKILFITITYDKEVSLSKFVDGKYIDEKKVSISLSNEEKNPKTSVGIYVLISIICLAISTTLILLIKNKMNTIPISLLVFFFLIPISIYALEKITIEINTKVEITTTTKTTKFSYSCLGPNHDESGNDTLTYIDGMTWEEFFNSDYAKDLNPLYKDHIKAGGFSFLGDEYAACLEEGHNHDDCVANSKVKPSDKIISSEEYSYYYGRCR